jgi:hypothetical protein
MPTWTTPANVVELIASQHLDDSSNGRFGSQSLLEVTPSAAADLIRARLDDFSTARDTFVMRSLGTSSG